MDKKHRFILISIDLFHLLLTFGSNVNYYKSVHQSVQRPIPTLPVGRGSTLKIFKIGQWTLLWIEFPDIFSSFPNWRGKRDFFWKSVIMNWRGITLKDYNLVDITHGKVSPLVKFEIILSLLCLLLDPLTNKHYRTWSSLINLWIDSRTCQK